MGEGKTKQNRHCLLGWYACWSTQHCLPMDAFPISYLLPSFSHDMKEGISPPWLRGAARAWWRVCGVHCHFVDLVKLAGRSCVSKTREGFGTAWKEAQRQGLREEGPKGRAMVAPWETAASGAVW
jgi:hypothetical protein